jgi:hypothetical protein
LRRAQSKRRFAAVVTRQRLKRDRDRSITRFAWLALLLHGAGWLGLRVTASKQLIAPQAVAPMRDFEVALELEPLPAEPQLLVPGSTVASAATTALPRAHDQAPRSAPAGAGPSAGADLETRADSADLAEEPAASSPYAELLTREQLGIGDNNPFLEVPSAPRPKKSAQARLQRSLTQALVKRDSDLGIGPAGPILTAIHQISLRELHVVNTAATLVAVVDSRGNLTDLTVAEVDADRKSWERVAKQTLDKLRGTKLLAKAGRNRTRLTLRVESREQLPSGAAPGPKVTLFGQTLKQGGGDRAHHIEIFKPELKLELVEVKGPDGKPMKIPDIRFMIIPFAAPFEPADWGQPGQRVVSTRVDKVDVLPEPVAPSDAAPQAK